MRLANIWINGRWQACIGREADYVPLKILNDQLGHDWATQIGALLETEGLARLNNWYRQGGSQIIDQHQDLRLPSGPLSFGPLYRYPHKIWGIGLNYKDHARDLSEKAPESEPASFMKPDTAIIGPGETIEIPTQSQRTTAEAELGVIIGQRCKNIARQDWLSVVAGFTTILDMTAEDILRRNPRYLTRAKSFDTFFAFGPDLITSDDISDVLALKVSTVINEQVHAENLVANMTFPPDYLVSFHSKVMTLMPGDIISTGTPGAVPIADGDEVECRIDGFTSLINPVRDLKKGNA
jgi:2-keto-4-pentenoate hydratase/2-oxohepta-3-ene-1,7-dioic acid hydratase in catechol pathway